MDLDAYVSVHRPAWDRLTQLVERPGRMRGAELDEVVELYQRASTHLSFVLTHSPDPVLVGQLTALVARARGVVTGRPRHSWAQVGHHLRVTFPAAAWRCRWWWAGAAVVTLALSAVEAVWIAQNPDVQATLLPAQQVHTLIERDFVSYYHVAPHSSFAAQVWTNNASIAAGCLAGGLLLGVPVVMLLAATALLQLGPAAGYLAADGKTGEFFALILPHGMLELAAVFLAGGAGLRLGWTMVAPGRRSRFVALAQEGRTTVALTGGLTIALLVSGLIEGFVTPSGIPPVPRVAIGAVALAGFLGWVAAYGRRADAAVGNGEGQGRGRDDEVRGDVVEQG